MGGQQDEFMMQALFTPVRESYESLQEFTRVFAQKCLKMSINSWRDGIGEEDGVGGEGHECGEEEKAELVSLATGCGK